jgi:hypothetical protein
MPSGPSTFDPSSTGRPPLFIARPTSSCLHLSQPSKYQTLRVPSQALRLRILVPLRLTGNPARPVCPGKIFQAAVGFARLHPACCSPSALSAASIPVFLTPPPLLIARFLSRFPRTSEKHGQYV